MRTSARSHSIVIIHGHCNDRSALAYRGPLTAGAIKRRLSHLRHGCTCHWAYLKINNRRVDDDQIAEVLKASGL